MSKIFSTLSAKISLTIVLMIVFIMSLVTYTATLRQVKIQRQEFRGHMARVARQIASIRLAETEGWYVYQNWIDNIISADVNHDFIYIAIFNEKDSLMACSLNTKWLDLGSTTYLSRDEQKYLVHRLVDGHIAEESMPDFDHVPMDIRWGNEYLGMVDVGFSVIDFNENVRHRLLTNLGLLAIFSLIGVVASVLISRRITMPLNRLSHAMLAVSKGDLNQSMRPSGRDEIGQLTKSFNYMIHGLREKQVIEKFGRALGFTYEIEKLVRIITKQLVQAMNAQQGVLFLLGRGIGGITAQVFFAYPASLKRSVSVPFHDEWAYMNKVLRVPSSIEHISDPEFREFIINLRKRCSREKLEWVAPLIAKDSLVGFLLLAAPAKQKTFNKEQTQFLSTLLVQASLAIKNSLLLKELTNQERLKQELEIARNVQKRLLPTKNPSHAGVDLAGVCIPATEVGGDYYDFFILSDNEIGIVIADVSGKGTSAAFYMAELKGLMSALTTVNRSPKSVLCKVNEHLYRKPDRRIFATMIYGILDTIKRRLVFVRAGHNALLIKRVNPHNRVEFIIPSGIGLGLAPNDLFEKHLEEMEIDLIPQDTVLFYTDGISEAMSKNRHEFGEKRLADILMRTNAQSMEILQKSILSEINKFVKNATPHDDITMVLAKTL